MKVKDYFIEQKNNTISDIDKFFLYEKINFQKNKKMFRNINTNKWLNIKSFAYGFMVVLLLFTIYGVFIFNGDFSYEGFVVQNNTNIASANHIANIIDFNGNFYIKHNNKYYKTNKISNGDSVILKNGSEIVMEINSGTKSKIVGPAKFSLQKSDDNYQFVLFEGDFVQMESTKQSNNMEIILDKISISSQDSINLLITKKNNEYNINNKGGKLIVKKDETINELKNNQSLAIKENDITLIQDIKDFKQAIITQNISQTFAIENQKNDQEISEKFLKEVSTDNINTNDENIDLQLIEDLGFVDGQAIPTKQQNEELANTLYSKFILLDLEKIYKSQLLGKQEDFYYQINLLKQKIQDLNKAFDLNIINSSDIIETILNTKQQLNNQYHIPSKYIDNLEIISKRIVYIQSIEHGSNTNIQEVDQGRENLETNPPNDLVLK